METRRKRLPTDLGEAANSLPDSGENSESAFSSSNFGENQPENEETETRESLLESLLQSSEQNVPPNETTLLVRQLWEVPAIAHFCSLFRTVFKLIDDFDIGELEEALVVDTCCAAEGGRSTLLVDLLIALLKGCIGRKDITLLNYNQFLFDLLEYKWCAVDGRGVNPIGADRDRANFHQLPAAAKAKLLQYLCEYRLERPDVDALTKNLEGDSLRVNSLGVDDEGNTYWYFYGTRLYQEAPEPIKIKISSSKKKKGGQRQTGGHDAEETATPRASPKKRRRRAAVASWGGSSKKKKRKSKVPPSISATEDDANSTMSTTTTTDQNDSTLDDEMDEEETKSTSVLTTDDRFDESKNSSPAPSVVPNRALGTADGEEASNGFNTMIAQIYSRDEDDEDEGNNEFEQKVVLDQLQTESTSIEDRMKREETDSEVAAVNLQNTTTEQAAVKDEPMPLENGPSEIKEEGPPAWDQPKLRADAEELLRWKLVCRDLSEWREFCGRFSARRTKREKELHFLLNEQFLPTIEDLFVKKEKDRRRRLALMAPRRASDRITVKRMQREDEQHRLEQRERAEKDRLASLERERQRRTDAEQRKQRLRQREQEKERIDRLKLRAREERSRRLELRQQRQELFRSGASQIPAELLPNASANFGDDDQLNEIDIEIELEHMYGQLEKVLETVQACPDAEPFMFPVSREEVADYYDIITEPMCIETIEAKLLEREYRTKMDFISDMNLMFINCFTYNGSENPYTKAAQRVERTFIRAWKRFFPPKEVLENERTRQDELKCVALLGALDSRIRALYQGAQVDEEVDEEDVDYDEGGGDRRRRSTPATASRQRQKRERELQRSRTAVERLRQKQMQSSQFGQQTSSTGSTAAYYNPPIRATTPRLLTSSFGRPRSSLTTTQPPLMSAIRMRFPMTPSSDRTLLRVAPQQQIQRFPSRQVLSVPGAAVSGGSQRSNVYLLKGADDGQDRLLKFVLPDGTPSPVELVQSVLPQIRKDLNKFPGRRVMTLTLDVKQGPPPVAPQKSFQANPPPAVTTSQTIDDSSVPGTSRTSTAVSSPPTMPTAEGTGENDHGLTPDRFYHLGGMSFLRLESGQPYLYRRSGSGYMQKVKELNKDGLVDKLKILQQVRTGQMTAQQVIPRATEVLPRRRLPIAAKPVCSVAPQPQNQPISVQHQPNVGQSQGISSIRPILIQTSTQAASVANTSTTTMTPGSLSPIIVQHPPTSSQSSTSAQPFIVQQQQQTNHPIIVQQQPTSAQSSSAVATSGAQSSGGQQPMYVTIQPGTQIIFGGNTLTVAAGQQQIVLSSGATPAAATNSQSQVSPPGNEERQTDV